MTVTNPSNPEQVNHYLKRRDGSWSCHRLRKFRLDSCRFDDIFTFNDVLLVRKSLHSTDEKFFKTFGHDDNVLPGLVVDVAVSEHLVEVGHALVCTPVVIVLQPLLDGSHVHGLFDDLEVVRKTKLDGVNGSVKGPGVGVFPHGLNDIALEDGNLVGVAATTSHRRMEGGLVHSIDRRDLHLRPGRRFAVLTGGERMGRLAVHGW